jgi:Na+/melibiose symporter-like transporter
MNPYVTSAFRLHSLTAATGIMSSIIGGLTKIPLAKLLDMWGRPQGLLLSLFVWMVGYIMMASCRNVETYAAAQVFSSTGWVTSKPHILFSYRSSDPKPSPTS